MSNDKIRIVKSAKYLDWLVEFTENTPGCAWDNETAHIQRASFTEYDSKNVRLLSTFIEYALQLARKQYVTSLPVFKGTAYRYHIKLRNNFYEFSVVGYSCISVFRKIEKPSGPVIYIDETIEPAELKDREFIQYILLNKDIDVPESVYNVHIAHACTICAKTQCNLEAFDIWFNEKQKIVILDAPQELMEKLESRSFGIRDTGHNNIPKNSLIALSLGILSKEEAMLLTKDCVLHKG